MCIRDSGLNIHPGSAKNKMVNSQYIAMEFQSLLPAAQKPEHTEGYEGFFHLNSMEGTVEETTLRYIIRDHDMAKFEVKKSVMETVAEFINKKYGTDTCQITIRDSYFNMKQCIEPVMFILDRAKKAMKAVGIEPREVPIRGGTDGARLSYEGLPCPNLCTGGENFHGTFEYAAFWTADEASADEAYSKYFICDQPDLQTGRGAKTSFGASVRCIRK